MKLKAFIFTLLVTTLTLLGLNQIYNYAVSPETAYERPSIAQEIQELESEELDLMNASGSLEQLVRDFELNLEDEMDLELEGLEELERILEELQINPFAEEESEDEEMIDPNFYQSLEFDNQFLQKIENQN